MQRIRVIITVTAFCSLMETGTSETLMAWLRQGKKKEERRKPPNWSNITSLFFSEQRSRFLPWPHLVIKVIASSSSAALWPPSSRHILHSIGHTEVHVQLRSRTICLNVALQVPLRLVLCCCKDSFLPTAVYNFIFILWLFVKPLSEITKLFIDTNVPTL